MNNSETQSKKRKPIIKVLGVGGGGSNAVNYMYSQGIVDVDFMICNTDLQAMQKSPVKSQIQIGSQLTEGRGAGNNPEKGRKAALESKDEIAGVLSEDTKMLFITAGMGGGTGTGAAPVIAGIARELGILTVGIVTLPFMFEGQLRVKQAIEGVEEMEKHVDTLLVINNEKLREMYGNQTISEAFAKADNVLTTAAKGIAEIITVHGYVNVDFADVCTVMQQSGVAIMGSATGSGQNRAIHAIKRALESPLLNSSDIRGAKNILLNVTSGLEEFRVDELGTITDYVQSLVKDDVQIIWGNGKDENLGDKISVVIIATGFQKHDIHEVFENKKKAAETIIVSLDDHKNDKQKTASQNIQGNIHSDNPESSKKESDESSKHEKLIDPEEELLELKSYSVPVSPFIAEKRKEIIQRKPIEAKSSKMSEWIQTTLDNLFKEEIE